MKKEEAKEIIARVIANYKGTLAQHQAIQEAFRALTEEEKENKQRIYNLGRIMQKCNKDKKWEQL